MPTPIAAAMTRVRRKPVIRETIVPAAITALDFIRLEESPACCGLRLSSGVSGASGTGDSPAWFHTPGWAECCNAALRPDHGSSRT